MKRKHKQDIVHWILGKLTIKEMLFFIIALMIVIAFILGQLVTVVKFNIKKQEDLERRFDSVFPSVEKMSYEFEKLPWYDHWKAVKMAGHIHATSYRYELDPWRVWSLGAEESGWYPLALSPMDAMGVMQAQKQHFERGDDPFCPYTNVERGCYYLAMCKAQVGYKYGTKREFQYMVYLYNMGINANPYRPHVESIGLWKRVDKTYKKMMAEA